METFWYKHIFKYGYLLKETRFKYGYLLKETRFKYGYLLKETRFKYGYILKDFNTRTFSSLVFNR